MEYFIIEVNENGEIKFVTKKRDLPKHKSKSIIVNIPSRYSIIFAIGWDLKKKEYYHKDIFERVLKKWSNAEIMGGGKLILNEDKFKIYDRSTEYGEMDVAHVSFYANKINADIGYPYLEKIKW